MRTTLNIDDALLQRASELTRIPRIAHWSLSCGELAFRRAPSPMRRASLQPILVRVHLRAVVLTTFCLATSFGCGERTVPVDSGIIVVVIDTLRADHLGAYGYARPTSPNLDRLAAEGERYRHAFSQAPWTLPVMASILTANFRRSTAPASAQTVTSSPRDPTSGPGPSTCARPATDRRRRQRGVPRAWHQELLERVPVN